MSIEFLITSLIIVDSPGTGARSDHLAPAHPDLDAPHVRRRVRGAGREAGVGGALLDWSLGQLPHIPVRTDLWLVGPQAEAQRSRLFAVIA